MHDQKNQKNQKTQNNQKKINNQHQPLKDIAKDLSDVLAESRTLTGLLGVIFGFLLNVIYSGIFSGDVELWLLELAILCAVVALGLFSMPVVYHHIQFPYKDKHKFVERSHWFIVVGFIPAIIMFYASITLALYRLFNIYSFIISLSVFLIIYLIYRERYRSRKLY